MTNDNLKPSEGCLYQVNLLSFDYRLRYFKISTGFLYSQLMCLLWIKHEIFICFGQHVDFFFFSHSSTWWVRRSQLCAPGVVHIFKVFFVYCNSRLFFCWTCESESYSHLNRGTYMPYCQILTKFNMLLCPLLYLSLLSLFSFLLAAVLCQERENLFQLASDLLSRNVSVTDSDL